MTIDASTLSVLATFFLDMAGAIIIFLGWLFIRNIRGDRKMVRPSFSNRMASEIVFEDHDEEIDVVN